MRRHTARATAALAALLTAQAALSGTGAHANTTTDAVPATPPAPGNYFIRNAANGQCLGVPNTLADGAQTALMACGASPAPGLKWAITVPSGAAPGTYQITSVTSGKCLMPTGPGAGAGVVQSTCHPSYPPQAWHFIPYNSTSPSQGQLTSKASNMDLTATPGSPPTPVIQTPPSPNQTQVWVFIPTS